MSEHQASKQIDKIKIGDVWLTLASWQPNEEYPCSYEIGYRILGDAPKTFHLIQWSGLRYSKAWDITKRLVIKGAGPYRIMKVLDWIGAR